MAFTPLSVSSVLDRLEAFHGPQEPSWPVDPYEFLVWWHCGYPASDSACARGWDALTRTVGVAPDKILKAKQAQLVEALRAGGMVPELRAMRLLEVASRVENEFAGDLRGGLAQSIKDARKALKKFPGISDPGADRILLFGGLKAVAAVPSNNAQVLVRIQLGLERENYGVNYRDAQSLIEAEVPERFPARMRAYLLLKQHGQELCKRTKPRCDVCPLASNCAFFAGKTRGRSLPRSVQKQFVDKGPVKAE